jgi:hypothetical protein
MAHEMMVEVGRKEAEDIFLRLLHEYPEYDDGSRRHSLFMNLLMNVAIYLNVNGWTEDELVQMMLADLQEHKKENPDLYD